MTSPPTGPGTGAAGAHAQAVIDMLIVVRHAVAIDREDWSGPDVARPLTPLGERQAEGLVLRLEDYPVERILASPAVRCLHTVAPLAHQRLVPVEAAAALGLDPEPGELQELLRNEDVRDAVLCTHGEVIGQVIAQLQADDAFEAESPQWPKGSTWLLQRLGRERVRGHYLPPLTYDPDLWPGYAYDPGERVRGRLRNEDHLATLPAREEQR